jgi:hypothetical protein
MLSPLLGMRKNRLMSIPASAKACFACERANIIAVNDIVMLGIFAGYVGATRIF